MLDGKYKMAINDSGKILLEGFRVRGTVKSNQVQRQGPLFSTWGPDAQFRLRCTTLFNYVNPKYRHNGINN